MAANDVICQGALPVVYTDEVAAGEFGRQRTNYGKLLSQISKQIAFLKKTLIRFSYLKY